MLSLQEELAGKEKSTAKAVNRLMTRHIPLAERRR